jgi:hypothetical protein
MSDRELQVGAQLDRTRCLQRQYQVELPIKNHCLTDADTRCLFPSCTLERPGDGTLEPPQFCKTRLCLPSLIQVAVDLGVQTLHALTMNTAVRSRRRYRMRSTAQCVSVIVNRLFT